MSVQHPTVSPEQPADLETTAELPVLDVVAYEVAHEHRDPSATDTWVAPQPAELRAGKADDRAPEPRSRLEEDLRSLSATLGDVEERLAHKGERLAAIESELETARAGQAAAEQRADAVSRELAESRLALSTARAEIGDLTERLASRDAQARLASDHDRSLEAALTVRDRALARAQQQLDEARLRTAAHHEGLQARDARRGVLETLLRSLEGEAAQRETQLAEARRDLAVHRERAGALAGELTAARERIAHLTAESGSRSTAGAQALTAALSRQRELEAAAAAQQSRVEALSGQLGELEAQQGKALADADVRHAEALAALESELRASRERLEAADRDLRAAEDMILRLESDLRTRTARVDELTRLNDDWRATLEAARQSLAERDALIRRLEAEAAHSTAVLDNIQHSVRFLDTPPGSEVEPEAAARLLIRMEGDGEVVHVLGRKTSIGRTPENDVQIDTKFVSRHHAVILAGPAHAIIEDLNSTNGVLVNGRRVTRQSLKDGDAITVGKTQFRFAVRRPS
ncbi:MAG: FHA domain-containing protein [Steroidobacteraceae bacterium]